MELHYEKQEGSGKKTPIFIIHTIPLDKNYLMTSIEKNVSPHDLYFIDLPGCGMSEDIPHEDMNLEYFTEAIEKLREKIQLNQIIIYGHGIGAFVAMKYAIVYRKFVEAMIISNSSTSSSYRKQMAWNIRSQFSHGIKDILDRIAGKIDEKSVRIRFTHSYSTHFHPINKEKANNLLDSAHRIASEPYVMISHYDIPKYNIRESIRKVERPTLILGGAYDVWPVEEVKKIQVDIPHGKLHFFKSGHFPMIDLPEKYWSTIFNWLDSLE